MEVYVIQETDIGDAECHGKKYSNLIIFEKDKINELSHNYMVENNIAEKIAKKENCPIEHVYPDNGKWDFYDFMEDMEHSEDHKRDKFNHNDYDMEISSYDLNNKDDLRCFYLTLKLHQEADCNFSLGIEKDVLYKTFGEENVDCINIIDKFSFNSVEAIFLKFDDNEIGVITERKTF